VSDCQPARGPRLSADYLRAVIAAAQEMARHVSAEGQTVLRLAAINLPLGQRERVQLLSAAEERMWKPLLPEVVTKVAAAALNEQMDALCREDAVDWLITAAQLGAWGHAEAVRAGAGRVLQ